jgi:hypothetical protein
VIRRGKAGFQGAQPIGGEWDGPTFPIFPSLGKEDQAGFQGAQPIGGEWDGPTFPIFPFVGGGEKL